MLGWLALFLLIYNRIIKMRKNKIKGIVYKATNKDTGETYIGATKDSLEKRIQDHLQKANSGKGHKFHEAIRTYGAEAFA